jgi:hypothetical protein
MRYINLIAAVLLSIAAAYMSVIGLNKIFPGIIWPFIILEGAKFVAAAYLHNNWKEIGLAMRAYMVAGVTVLMVMTSAGIYGYLSNSAMQHTTSTVQEQTQVEFIQDKIKSLQTRREELVVAKQRLDKIVDGYASLNDPNAAVRSASQFNRQKSDRANIDQTIDTIDRELVDQKLKLSTFSESLNKVKAEIGPGIYLAQIIYGSSSMTNIERAIQIVILLIIFTFDPMAVVMMINASKQFDIKTPASQPLSAALPQVAPEIVPEPVVKPKRKYTRKKKEENVIATVSHDNQPFVEPVELSILPDPVEPNTRVETPVARRAAKLRKRQHLIEEAIQRVELPT